MKNQILQLKKTDFESEVGSATKKPLSVKLLGPKDDIGKAINLFLSGKTGKYGKYIAVENALVYRTILTTERDSEPRVEQNIIAIRLSSGLLLGNSSVLPLIGRRVSFGRESLGSGVSEVQTRISEVIPMLPFTIFRESGLSISKVKILDQGPEETVTRDIPNPKYNEYGTEKQKSEPKTLEESVHFTGSKLFEVDGVQFLFDLDRVELSHKIFNPFLAKLSVKVKTIRDAYESLKPEEVKDAEKSGLKVLRQGEWFLIESEETPENPKATNKILMGNKNNQWQRFTLQAGRNRPNYADYGFKIGKDSYISGKLEHSGREHKPIILKGWFRVVPNTAVESFQISGDID
jgi:hypothetical protein